jgi:hypothetical protein
VCVFGSALYITTVELLHRLSIGAHKTNTRPSPRLLMRNAQAPPAKASKDSNSIDCNAPATYRAKRPEQYRLQCRLAIPPKSSSASVQSPTVSTLRSFSYAFPPKGDQAPDRCMLQTRQLHPSRRTTPARFGSSNASRASIPRMRFRARVASALPRPRAAFEHTAVRKRFCRARSF